MEHGHRERRGSCSYRSEGGGRPPLYRSRNGVIFGICRGVADHLGVSAFWTRVIALLLTFMTGFWGGIALYIIAAFLMKLEPVVPFKEEAEHEFYDSYMNSRSMALHRLKRTFDSLDRRIQRMEDIVTARDYDWDERMKESRSS